MMGTSELIPECFVDFQKAFDSVWHGGLFRKLENKGINGNFLKLIKNIYGKRKYAVKINNKSTNLFNYDKGVQQGNPLLFDFYINDIFEIFRNECPVNLGNEQTFNALMSADDVIMSSTQEGLQRTLEALNDFWRLSINHKKTK